MVGAAIKPDRLCLTPRHDPLTRLHIALALYGPNNIIIVSISPSIPHVNHPQLSTTLLDSYIAAAFYNDDNLFMQSGAFFVGRRSCSQVETGDAAAPLFLRTGGV